MAQQIHLKAGEEYQLRLPWPGSVGYRWDFALEEGSNVVDVARLSAEKPSGEGDLIPRTSSVDALFSIRALAPGRARVHFVLQSPWIIGKVPPSQEHVLDVTIQ